MPETVASILASHRARTVTPEQTIARTITRIRAHGDAAIFISLRDEADLLAEARALGAKNPEDYPLYGIPVAIKDNIDVAGLPTTAACPSFTYMPQHDATVVGGLRKAGAIIVGKTNLDQFATGLVGTRSPYGIPRNPLNPDLVPGGSSSGSAVAVAAGLVPLALGTDTAGSGRIPAGLNNIVGLKPSRGMLSTTGVVPACRSLDCVSVFALTVDDAFAALQVMAAHDPSDPFSRSIPPGELLPSNPHVKIGVPRLQDLHFFGDAQAEASFSSAIENLAQLNAEVIEVDFTPFLETARLLYEGPWIAERYAAVGAFIEAHLPDIHPITRNIIMAGKTPSAVDTFRAFYRLAELRTQAIGILKTIDMLMVPTVPAVYTVAQLDADPIALNSNLGTYTNFANLLDLAAIAVPNRIAANGTPFGVTLLAPARQDATIAGFADRLHRQADLPLGALGIKRQANTNLGLNASHPDKVALVVVGAHMSGMPLNNELRILGANLMERCITSPDYRLFALPGTVNKPGLLRVSDNEGTSIEAEIWSLSFEAFGRFVATVPPPMSIGTVRLADGRIEKGFLVEAAAINGARDISEFGGWRPYVASAGA
ncbi:MAG: allophanate hydrolase [Afipia sp. 62-7]|nr:allophanate hydrolase [Alphaproteobacteria bacterium]OJU14618.1 MAG: allophanate hydrolase [Afipia sp. 62-7]